MKGWPWYLRSKIRKITRISALKFTSLFFVWINNNEFTVMYLQVFLNTSEITKFEKKIKFGKDLLNYDCIKK